MTVKEKEGTQIVKERKTSYDLSLIITPQYILALRTDSRNRNTGKLNGLATLHAIEKVKQGIDDIESVKIQCRQFAEDQPPWILQLRMKNADVCVNQVVRLIREEGFKMSKGFEKSRKILVSEVTSAVYDGLEVEKLEAQINETY